MNRLVWPAVLLFLAICILIALRYESPPPIRVGILHSLSGTMAISEKPVMEATLHAIEQINEQGGLLGRKIEPVVVDTRSDMATFRREAERLISEEKVSVIFGCWTSAGRKNVKTVVEKHNHLLLYPVQYEGLEKSPNIIYLGAAPNQQLIPAVTWAIEHLGSRAFMVGSDYIFPRVANALMGKQIELLKGEIIGERYVVLGETDLSSMVDEISRLKPDFILNTINGDSNIHFFRKLQQAGITADNMPVISFSIGESELAVMESDLSGHYAAWNYFQSIDSKENEAFIREFRNRYGESHTINDPMVSAWSGVHLWAAAVKAANTDHPRIVREAMRHQSIRAPDGIIAIDHETQHTWKTPRIGKIIPGGQFDIVWTMESPVRPEPFPEIMGHQESAALLDQLYRMWGSRWAAPFAHKQEQQP